ncbi:hypothetical protein P153DRAFT_360752 [Dothidotthia symphoricarpi CBS 119687]|uniref:Uncharacterized protein n=1 Tax=Dothidotthia symphoricarpi CBS 119687 TaxID=1392245 RepID=A0A6A6A3I9_9PLEO|nr:uncharacterized protein P153DRAFT_360752 [Dothidotthia symphoricarpi CBS 119687]KAF2125151.1 hypothetical protein P153DRAFT_360752 [Dothidotthia symphoricarpi CBS 119687]
MYLHLLIGSVLSSPSFAALLTPTSSTSDATITPGPQIELLKRQNGDQFMGWLSNDGTWGAESCNAGGTFYQTDEYWACCATTAAGCEVMPHACVSGSLIYSLSSSGALATIACTDAYTNSGHESYSICNTLFLYENEQDSQPETNVNCGISSLNFSYYRVAPAAATAGTSSSSAIASNSGSTTALTPVNTSTSSTTTKAKTKKKSKAWIAGVVIGPLLLFALIGFCLAKRKKKNAATVQPAHATGAPPTTSTAPVATYPQQTTVPGQSPQYFPPPMQQTQPAPNMVPFGVTKHDSWAPSPSPAPVSPAQQWPQQGGTQMGGQPVYNAPSPTVSPQQQYAQPVPYAEHGAPYKQAQPHVHESKPFSSELEGDGVQRR